LPAGARFGWCDLLWCAPPPPPPPPWCVGAAPFGTWHSLLWRGLLRCGLLWCERPAPLAAITQIFSLKRPSSHDSLFLSTALSNLGCCARVSWMRLCRYRSRAGYARTSDSPFPEARPYHRAQRVNGGHTNPTHKGRGFALWRVVPRPLAKFAKTDSPRRRWRRLFLPCRALTDGQLLVGEHCCRHRSASVSGRGEETCENESAMIETYMHDITSEL
jgi:hypothetical protein